MHKKQTLQEAELGDGNIARHDSLHSFSATDPNPNICLLNHADIVRAITDCQCDFTGASFHKPSHKCFLLG